MTLLISVFAAVVSTLVWYLCPRRKELKLSVLCFMFWGASIMWLVDAITEYIELGAEYFAPELQDMANDAFLGLSVVALALVIWIVFLLIKDPEGIVRKELLKK